MKKRRAAQIWAVEIASNVTERLRQGAELPFRLPLDGYTKGQATRFAQEVNYAKRMQDEQEQALYVQRSSSGEACSRPIPLAWAISFRMEGEAAVFTVNFPASRSRQQTEITKKFTSDALAALDALPMPEAGLKPSAPTEDDILNSYLYGDKS